MSSKITRLESRTNSYGQQRSFRGLEKFAIQRRLRAAYSLMDQLVSEGKNKDLTVLELGCGFYGNNLRAMHQEFPQVKFVGVDVAVDDRSTQEIKLIRADLRTWKPNTIYNAVFSLAVAEHLVEPLAHFAMISKCLHKHGLAGITTPAPEAHRVLAFFAMLGIFDKREILDHQMYLTENGLRNLAVQTDMEVLEYKKFSLGFNQWMLLRKN